jgi:hypothetical protein
MSAKLDLPGTDASSGVFSDGQKVAATKKDNRWIVTNEVSGRVTLEVK